MFHIGHPQLLLVIYVHTLQVTSPYLQEYNVVGASGASKHFTGVDRVSASSKSHLPLCSDLELSSLGHVLDSFEGFVLLTVHIQPVHLQS